MTQLSPQAQAVLDAVCENTEPDCDTQHLIAAAQWGADQELEACCEWLRTKSKTALWQTEALRAARRPKPPSLKKLALLQLDVLNADLFERGLGRDLSQIRRALEQLDD